MVSNKASLKSLIEDALALEEVRKIEDALCKWKEIRALEDTPYAALQHCRLAKKLGLWDEVEKAGLTGVQLDPTNPDFYLYIGTTYMCTRNYALAEQNLRKALKLDPAHEEAMYNLAEVLRYSVPDEAIELYRKSLEIDPNYAAAYRGLAFVFYDTEQFEEAEDHAQRALKLDMGDWATHTILGRLFKRKEKFKAAKAELQRGAELGMGWFEAQSALASFYDDRGNLHEAAEAYRKCLALEPEDVWANRRYGAVLADMGEIAQARVFFKRALTLDPQDKASKAYLDRLSGLYPHRQLRNRRTPRRTQD